MGGGYGTPDMPHPGCNVHNPFCDTTDSSGGSYVCKCAKMDSDSVIGSVCSNSSNVCFAVGASLECRCGNPSTNMGSDKCVDTDDSGTATTIPSCLLSNAFVVGEAKSKCSQCRKDNGDAGDGADQGTCDNEKICYADGSCRGSFQL